MLNSDISDTETQPQPDIDRASLSSAASSEFSIDIKAEAENEERFDKLCVKTGSSPVHEGLLKIASPLPPSASVLSRSPLTPPSASPSPRTPSPGPPVLEPMTSIPGKVTPPSTLASSAPRTSISLPTVPLPPPPLVTSVTRPQQTVTSAILGQQTVTSCQQSSFAAPAVATPAAAGQGPIQQIILPPVQAGQQQQFILQPQQLAAAAGQSTAVAGQFAPPQNPLVQQSVTPQTGMVQQALGQPMIQIVQAGLPLQYNTGQAIPLLNPQGQLMATVGGVGSQAQLVSNLQNFVMMVQPTLQQAMGTTTATINQPVTINQGNPPIIIKQEPMASIQQPILKPMPTTQPAAPINIAPATTTTILQQPQPTFISNNSVTTTPIKLGQSLPSTPLISSQPNFNVVQTPSGQSFNIISQPQVTGPPSTPQQPTILQHNTATPAILPSSNILQPQSNAMNILANSSSQVTTASNINMLPSTQQQPPQQSNVQLSIPQTAASSSPSVQLVQDPNTGLFNLVQQPHQQQQLVTTAINSNPLTPKLVVGAPAPLTSIVAESPKRCGTPLTSGSPMKVPKLLLPSSSSSSLPVPGTKENKPEPPAAKQFMCGVCNKYFGNQKNLRVHISEIHEGKRGKFPCDICHKVFPRKRNMERHKNALHLKNSPQCNLCHKSVVNLEMHVKRFHKSSTEIKTETQIKVEATSA